MRLEPHVGQQLNVSGTTYVFTEHPVLRGAIYAQRGRQAYVFQLQAVSPADQGRLFALKVFHPQFRTAALARLESVLPPLAHLPALSVCDREMITPQGHAHLLATYPDLCYAATMPWIVGPTWREVVVQRRRLGAAESGRIAAALAHSLAKMESMSIAHCDLSGQNLIVPALADAQSALERDAVALVDVELIFTTQHSAPDPLPMGLPGYAHQQLARGYWAADADRFAGSVLIGEILGWCDPKVRASSASESYFEPNEMHRETDRYRTLTESLRTNWGDEISALFTQAWHTETLGECPGLASWSRALGPVSTMASRPVRSEMARPRAARSPGGAASTHANDEVSRLIQRAEQLAESGRYDEAFDTYRMAYERATPGSDSRAVIAYRMDELRAHRATVGTMPTATGARPGDATEPQSSGPGREWTGPVAETRSERIQAFAWSSLGVAVGLLLGLLVADGVVQAIALSLSNALGRFGPWTVATTLEATVLGLLEAWLFRGKLPTSRIAEFVWNATLAGVIGGCAGGVLLNFGAGYELVGALTGGAVGGISSWLQGSLISDERTRAIWFTWVSSSWAAIWLASSWFTGHLPAGQTAAAAGFVTLATGISLAAFLHWVEIEF